MSDSSASARMAWRWWRDWYIYFANFTSWRSVMRSTPVWKPSTSSTKVTMQALLLFLYFSTSLSWPLPVFPMRLSSFVCIPSDIRGLSNISQLEQLNKRYWYVCQDYTEYKYPHQPKRFPEIMMCLPEIRCIAGKATKYLGVRVRYGVLTTAAFRC